MENVGFIGLGDIGLPMAKRVIGGGYKVTVCGHVRRESVEEMKKAGAEEVSTPQEVASASDVTITMVRDDTDTGEIVLGPKGVLEGSQAGSGIIMMSTLSPAFCKKVGQAGKERGVDVLDAPVSGTNMRAATGELTIMVGGEKGLVEKYRSVLETMGRITYCGDLGAGQIVKLVNNMTLSINRWGLMEALNWGVRSGADEDLLIEVLKDGTGNSWVVENWKNYIKPSAMTYPRTPRRQLAAKDFRLMIDIANEMNICVPLASLCSQLEKIEEAYLHFWK